jgi:hypothetical protein
MVTKEGTLAEHPAAAQPSVSSAIVADQLPDQDMLFRRVRAFNCFHNCEDEKAKACPTITRQISSNQKYKEVHARLTPVPGCCLFLTHCCRRSHR